MNHHKCSLSGNMGMLWEGLFRNYSAELFGSGQSFLAADPPYGFSTLQSQIFTP
jgi:hypothetical protein